MLYELRTYHANPGKMPELLAQFRTQTRALLERHGMVNVGYWLNDVGGHSDELIYMLAFEDAGQRERAWDAFHADPDWLAYVQGAAGHPPLVAHIENRLLKPTDFSPLS